MNFAVPFSNSGSGPELLRRHFTVCVERSCCLWCTESDARHDSRRLRSHRYVGADRTRGRRLCGDRHRAETLERHAGQPAQTDRPVAHTARGHRERVDHHAATTTPSGIGVASGSPVLLPRLSGRRLNIGLLYWKQHFRSLVCTSERPYYYCYYDYYDSFYTPGSIDPRGYYF